jgi:Fic family protein
MKSNLLPLPHSVDLETKAVLKQLSASHRALAELKGIASTIPNEQILISTLTIEEAKDSSIIENIVTTYDELFRAEDLGADKISEATKEVRSYATALRYGFDEVKAKKIITNKLIQKMQEILVMNNAGFRKQVGTVLKNAATQAVIYTPPQHPEEILELMANLERYINDDDMQDIDPLIKMAIIHHQFESIHPFYDGNGRTGRIINVLYLVSKDLLDLPILYLSRYIVSTKNAYYRYLQEVREIGNWESYVLYMLKGIEQTSRDTIAIILKIRDLMQQYKQGIRTQLPKIYSQDLLNNLFKHPYTKAEFLEQELLVSRLTATKYLKQLAAKGFLHEVQIGRNIYFMNIPLLQLFTTSESIERSLAKYL